MLLFLLDLLLPHAVGFVELAAVPYVGIVLATVAFSGGVVALTVAAGSVLWIIAAGPILAGIGPFSSYAIPLSAVPMGARYGALLLAAAGLFLVDRVRKMRLELRAGAEKMRDLESTAEMFRAEAHALKLIHTRTRNRLATERSSITILHEQIQRLQSFDRTQVLDATLTAVRLMTGATSCALYRFHEETLELERMALWPARHDSRYPQMKAVASSIEGYVVRTGQPFSLRNLIDNPELRELEARNAVICVPIVTRNQIWGVLTVGRIPFLYYNEHAEKALQVTAAIVAPALDQALPLVSMEGAAQPALFSYDMLHEALQERLHAAGELGFHVMVLLVELQTSLEFNEQMELSRAVGEDIAGRLGQGVAVFQYQQAHQLALVSVSTRSEAAGYLLLRVTDLVSSKAWTVEDETVLPRTIIGFGTSAQSGYDVTALLNQAETMLTIYRRAQG